MSDRQCRYCGVTKSLPCMSTRDCEDSVNKICTAALMVAGGGEYTWRGRIATMLECEGLMPSKESFKRQISAGKMEFVNVVQRYIGKS